VFFRNLTLFRFSTAAAASLDDGFARRLKKHAARPCGPLEMSTRGWVAPLGRGEAALEHELGDFLWLTLGGEDKILPPATVNAAVAERADKLEAERGKPPGGRERKRLKEEVLNELVPRALSRPIRLNGYCDRKTGWAVVDTPSSKQAEAFVSQIRATVDSFPAAPLDPGESPKAVLTDWLAGGKLPEGWALGDECELKDPGGRGAVVRARRLELDSGEVREHLKTGKQASQLGLVVEERMSFTIDENLVIRKLRFLEAATEALEASERDSAVSEAQARFAFMSMSLRPLLATLAETFKLARPRERH
jgi:recombination associated protein RdgC